MILEPIENYPKDRNIEYFKMDCSEQEDFLKRIKMIKLIKKFFTKKQTQIHSGYEIVREGKIQVGDILYNCNTKEYDKTVTTDEKFRFIYGVTINEFGVLRKI